MTLKQIDKDQQMDLMQHSRNQRQAEKILKGKKHNEDKERAWEDDRL